MIKQTKASRWLKVLETADGLFKGAAGSYDEHFRLGQPLPKQAQELLINHGADGVRLAVEADPPVKGTDIAELMNSVAVAVEHLKIGPGFASSIKDLRNAIAPALTMLKATVEDQIESADDIISELERGFMLSLVLSMSKHHAMATRVGEWESAHQRFVQEKTREDIGHYFSMSPVNQDELEDPHSWAVPNFYATEPGQGRIHMHHLAMAIHSGANIMVAGSSGTTSTDYYPEAQAIEYAQWFTYIAALWDDQFRKRFADYFSLVDPNGVKYSKNDIVIDLFGDIRLLRNDFVHHKGEVTNATRLKALDWKLKKGEPLNISLEQMIELMNKFPRAELAERPEVKPQTRKPLPRSVDAVLLDRYSAYMEAHPSQDFTDANDEMLKDWLTRKGLM